MIKRIIFLFFIVLSFVLGGTSQVPLNIGIQILKAEDARRYDDVLVNLMKSPNADVRKRATLAAGRIGKEEAIAALVRLLESDPNAEVRAVAAFALGETESIKAANAVLSALGRTAADAAQAETRPLGSVSAPLLSGTLPTGRVSARLVEAAGKIAAANPKDERSKQLGTGVLSVLDKELKKQGKPDTEVIRLALTAVLRARPAGADEIVRRFLSYTDPTIVSDALNTLARLRAKNANRDARDLLATHTNAIVRANAARVLGAAEDKDSVDVLISAATKDVDARVRVAAIRSLASVRDAKAAEPLLKRGETLLAAYQKAKKPNFLPVEQSEFLEIAAALGRIMANTHDGRAVDLFRQFGKLDLGHSPEAYIARLRVAPGRGDNEKRELTHWRQYSTLAQVVGEFAAIQPTNDEGKRMKSEAPGVLKPLAEAYAEGDPKTEGDKMKAAPEGLRAYAAFKTEDLEAIMRTALNNQDVFVRATAAELLAEHAPTSATRIALENAFKKALTTDKHDNDAQLAMLDAMAKINKAAALDTIYKALEAPDYLVRKKALELLHDPELISKNPNVASVLTLARDKHQDQVWQYEPKNGTKLGQVLNTDAVYRRALARRNGRTKAAVTTQKGTFTIDLLPEDAPLTVDNFVKLARARYFNGLEVHRVVPNFVMQDGDPRGDGNGGPGWSIRCEINMVPFERGAVGMALSGKDTGGSQWFVTHSPQPHLDGGYTVFGRVNETGMKVVDKIVRGDRIVSIRILEGQRPLTADKRR